MRFFNQEVKTHTGAYLSLFVDWRWWIDQLIQQPSKLQLVQFRSCHSTIRSSLSRLLIYIASSAQDERCELWMEASKENTRGWRESLSLRSAGSRSETTEWLKYIYIHRKLKPMLHSIALTIVILIIKTYVLHIYLSTTYCLLYINRCVLACVGAPISG